MNSSKRLWLIIGPVITAFIILLLLLLSPINFAHNSAETERRAAVSLAPQVFKGRQIKKQALAGKYVPFFGSSELSRMDPLHPSVLAQKYHRNYRPFLLGAAGTQSLTQYYSMQTIDTQMKNKKAVFIISPQWFVPQGARPDAFGFYYSKLQTVGWLQQIQNTKMNRYAAQRLLEMPSGHSDHAIAQMLRKVAKGKPLSNYNRLQLSVSALILSHEDQLFSDYRLGHNLSKIDKGVKQLPDSQSYAALDKTATTLGKENTTNNSLGIKNSFYSNRLRGHVAELKGEQAKFDYRKSPEYSDFELVLNQFAQTHTDVLFILPPINERWAKYTGLNREMIDQTNNKIKQQLSSQGFNNVLDLSQDGGQPYFMEDTIHLGWRGWVAVDKGVRPFMANKQAKPQYHINTRYYSKDWQQLDPTTQNLTSFK
ncbi:D-alanyl-lipoteichoic acid biosynthesis protein DltD [Furfurilactobacillus milii]|uniref:Protein DltD n=2 Tax=Furfurilactobacillus TaxID=2767882 RepID=A0ABT6DBP4_9LACO|nr:D-alanyl-lipoteichoic acid biosynthesis protein DltD [Furfurilactobacillus milii]QLE66843.1 Polyglycerophosphate chain D-alanine transfer protein DltD [Furfurilactobacillus rossiae]MCF6161664.1 D-alanyl-lipoteichoic acid biosynthesis protein DltD [Furfurilactobacillus milii]MCF6164044.1 D-alanyl-lipoteichoic acid biosynthesis protein DltD [Furfurilactobacillus milii]MDF9914481.1 D-alanyl-lipoteichoic acid biosynthesis protein DltD [Furfurilactobacillus milii]QLE69273.1 Polyglycerophosphate 